MPIEVGNYVIFARDNDLLGLFIPSDGGQNAYAVGITPVAERSTYWTVENNNTGPGQLVSTRLAARHYRWYDIADLNHELYASTIQDAVGYSIEPRDGGWVVRKPELNTYLTIRAQNDLAFEVSQAGFANQLFTFRRVTAAQLRRNMKN